MENKSHIRSSLASHVAQAPTGRDAMDELRRAAWREQGVLNIAPSDPRLRPAEREFVRQIGERVYGGAV